MSNAQEDFSNVGFAKTFVLPALLIFLVPVISYFFFRHVLNTYNDQARTEFLNQIEADKELTEEDRQAWVKLVTEVPFSDIIQHEEFAGMVDRDVHFQYSTFRWMILLSSLSIASGIAVFLLAGICVLLSSRSQYAQYLSLSIGWHFLRIYGALQTIVQGILIIALSFWVTAFWFEVYIIKLIAMAGILTLMAIIVVIVAIFKKPNMDFNVEGEPITKDNDMPLWQELRVICDKVGVEVPDQVIAGVDDNFFVTEQPVTVKDQIYSGKTLFVSLSLLKQLRGTEADAVLAHEMAHFSGQDTMYSKKIQPLLIRYDHYLQGLFTGGITLPIFYFMLCFRAFYELSLGKVSRQREFRADKIAVQTTTPRDLAGALLRIVAYSHYRNTVEQELFKQEQALEFADVSGRIEEGFPNYAVKFIQDPEIGDLATTHPFDSHPALAQRFEAIRVDLNSAETHSLLNTQGDGRWFQHINNAEQLEREQWDVFEEQFRKFHEETLPYRFLPETEQQREVVEQAFPLISFEGKKGNLTLDFEKVEYSEWSDAVLFSEVTQMELNDSNILTVHYQREGKHKLTLKMKLFAKSQQEVLDAINRYYTRYLAAVDYQEQKQSEENTATD